MTDSPYRKCALCGKALPKRKRMGRVGYYCSKAHRSRAGALRRQGVEDAPPRGSAYTMEDDESPLAWDGETQLHTSKPTVWHEAICLLCARTVHQQDAEAWVIIRRTRRCQVCGGSVYFQTEDVGQIGSPSSAVPLRLKSRNGTIVPTGRRP